MIRPMFAETERYGEYSSRASSSTTARSSGAAGASGRTSPARAGPWLLEQEINFEEIQGRVDALAMLGTPYGELVTDGNAVIHARHQAATLAAELESQGGPPASETQDKKVIAMIAYLQRLGTDIYKDPADIGKALAMPGSAPAAEGESTAQPESGPTEGAADASE
jgi:cytochrome c oxidase cbb3-type subunit I/II